MCLLMDNTCHRKRNDYKIEIAIDTFWQESIVNKIGKVLVKRGAIGFRNEEYF